MANLHGHEAGNGGYNQASTYTTRASGPPNCSTESTDHVGAARAMAQRARGHSHREALRPLGAKWLKIIFVLWERQVPYDESYHLVTMARQQLRQRSKKIA